MPCVKTTSGRQVAVELAEQSISVFFSPIRQTGNEVLDLLAGGIAQGFHPAEIGGIGFDQGGIELVLADDLAKAITNLGHAITVSVRGLRGNFARASRILERARRRSNLFNRANTNAIGLAEGAVYRSGFRNSHFSAVDER